MSTVRLFHGTAHRFDAFDERFTMRGSESNSGLGIHLTQHPSIAADYAELSAKDNGASSPQVLVVEVDVSRIAVVSEVSEFLGYQPGHFDPDTNISREDFVAARHMLQAEGFDGVAMDECSMDDLNGAWVIFDPANLRIVGRFSLDEAREADESEYVDIEFVECPLFPDGILDMDEYRLS